MLETRINATNPQSKNKLKKFQIELSKKIKSFRVLVMFIVLLLIIFGGTVAYILSQTPQDLRQQASTSTGTAILSIKPTSSTLSSNQTQQLQIVGNMGVTGKQIVGVQFAIDLSGDIPFDIQFSPSDQLGMNVVTNSMENTEDGKRILYAIIPEPPNTYTTTADDLILGTLDFTSPSSGRLTVAFNPILTKIIEYQKNINLIASIPTESYIFANTTTSTPYPTFLPTQPIATKSPVPSSTPKPTSTVKPTATPGSGGPSTTPMPLSDLSLTKKVFPTNANIGDTVRYTIEVKNSGPGLANDVSVNEQFNSSYGIKFISSSYSQGSFNMSSGTWNVGTLSANQTATLTIDIEGTAPTTISNTAQIATSSTFDHDSTPGNNNPNEDDQETASVVFSQIVNPTAIPTNRPSSTPIPTNTQRPTATPIQTITNFPTSTQNPRPSVYPTFIPFPTTTPDGGINNDSISIDITSPSNGQTISGRSSVDIKARVAGSNQIASVKFYVNNIQICSDSRSPYSCRWRVWIWRLFRRNLKSAEIKAIVQDVSGNSAQHTIQVQVK